MKHFSKLLFLGCLISVLPLSFADQSQVSKHDSERYTEETSSQVNSHEYEQNFNQNLSPVATVKYDNLEKAFKKIKNADSNTVVIINCENVVNTQLDSAFVYKKDYEKSWNYFYEKLNGLSTDRKEAILDSLHWGSAKAIIDQKKFKPYFEKLLKSKARILFVCKIENMDQNFFSIFSNISEILRGAGIDIVKGLAPNNDRGSISVMTINRKEGVAQNKILTESSDETKANENSIVFFNKDLAEGLKDCLSNDLQNKKIQRAIVLSSESLGVDTKTLQIPVENINFEPQVDIINKLSEDTIRKQFEVILACGYWVDDQEIVSISQKAPKDLIFDVCTRDIFGVCPCQEVNEVQIYKKIKAILGDRQAEGISIPETIDCFQEINASFGKIFQIIVQRHLWEIGEQLGLDVQARTDILSKIPEIDFLKVRVEGQVFSSLRNTCSGIHWKDLAKYSFLKSKMFDTPAEDPDYGEQCYTDAHNTYKQIMDISYKRDAHEINTLFNRIKREFAQTLSVSHKDKLERACSLLKLDYNEISSQLSKGESLENKSPSNMDNKESIAR